MYTVPHLPASAWRNLRTGRRRWPSGLRLLGLMLLTPYLAVAAHKWEEIPAEQLNAKPETPDAVEEGAEVLLSRRTLELNAKGMEWDTFNRLKVYSERAAEVAGRLQIRVSPRQNLRDCGARVIRGGAVLRIYGRKEFTVTNMAETEYGDFGMHQLQITDLRPGDLVELFHELAYDASQYTGFGSFFTVNVQESWPIRELDYTVKSVGWQDGQMNYSLGFRNLPGAVSSKSGDILKVSAKNVRAYRKEKDAPPDADVRGSLVVDLFMSSYSGSMGTSRTPWSKNWDDYLKSELETMGGKIRANGAIKKLAASLGQGVATPEEKVRRLHDYCQREILNLTYEDLEGSRAPTKEAISELNAALTLERRYGTPFSITCLFVSLCQAAGLEATLAATTSANSALRADRIYKGWWLLTDRAAAVKLDGKWVYYSPGMRWAPFGQWYWQNQGTAILPLQKGKPAWEIRPQIPTSDQDKFLREGKFDLSEHGALEGAVTETLNGQHAMGWRTRHKGKKLPALEKVVRQRVERDFPLAQVTEIKIEDDRDSYHPVVLRYQMSVPDYATLAGGRIIFAPNVLNARAQPRYTDTAPRLSDIRFEYGLVGQDQVELHLPANYELEAGAAPKNVELGEVAGITHVSKLSHAPKTQRVFSTTTLTTGLGGKINFPAKGYPALKQIFEKINEAQTHTLVLKPKPGYTPTPPPEATPPASGEAPAEGATKKEAGNDADL